MSALYRTSSRPSAATWQDAINEIKTANQERNRLLPIMTAYERQTVSEYISGLKEQYRPTIEAGVLATWNGAKENLRSALKNVEAQKRKVTNSWEAAKLSPELQVYTVRIAAAATNGDLESLKAIYQEAKDSGDRYKIRAAAEALQATVKKIPNDAQDSHGDLIRMTVNRMEKTAAADLENLRTSPELTAAHELASVKVSELDAARKLIVDTAQTFGELAPNESIIYNTNFNKALASVTQDAAGNIIFEE
jgi:hypothetical protein